MAENEEMVKKEAAPERISEAAREPVSRVVVTDGVREERSLTAQVMPQSMAVVRKCSLTFGSHSSP